MIGEYVDCLTSILKSIHGSVFTPLKDWKNGTGKVGQLLPKYQPEAPPSEATTPVTLPQLHVCKVENESLVIPGETRAKYISDPHRGPEWRNLLVKFDRSWSSVGQSVQPQQSQVVSAQPATVEAANAIEDGPSEGGEDTFSWDSIFSDEPKTQEDLEQKLGAGCHKFVITNNLTAVVHEGPKLFYVASADVVVDTDEPTLCFGAGNWVLDAKAERFLQDGIISKLMFVCWISYASRRT